MKTKKSWKEKNWDMWTFGKKVRHVLAVITSIITSIITAIFIIGITAYVLLILLGMHGILLYIRDEFIFGMMRYLLGG